MAITPISGTDTVSFINDPVGNKANALVVIPVNADGTAMGGGSAASPSIAGGEYNSTPPTLTNGQTDAVQFDSRGSIKVTLISPDSPTPISTGPSTSDAITPTTLIRVGGFGYIYNGSTWDRANKPSSTSRLVSAAASTNATSVKASAGNVFRVTGFNANAAARYLKLYNLAVAPTVGTSTPVWTEYLAPQAKFIIDFPTPLYFGTGISYALTTGSADSDTGALTAGDVLALNIAYQ